MKDYDYLWRSEMEKLDIIDCLFMVIKGEESAKDVYLDWLHNIKSKSHEDTTNMVGIIDTINECYEKSNHTEDEKNLAIFIAGTLYEQ